MKQNTTLHAFVLFRFDPKWNGETNRSRVIGTFLGDERNVRPNPRSNLEARIVECLKETLCNAFGIPQVSFRCILDTTFPHYIVATSGIWQRLWQRDHPAKDLLVLVDSQNAETFSEKFRLNKRFDALVETIAKELPTRKLVASAVFIPNSEYTKELSTALTYTRVGVYLCEPRRVSNPVSGVEWNDHNIDPALIRTAKKLVRQYAPGSICIVSGDGGYIPLLEELQGQGVEVGVASTKEKLNRFLSSRAQYIVSLDELMPAIGALPRLALTTPPPSRNGFWKQRNRSVSFFKKKKGREDHES